MSARRRPLSPRELEAVKLIRAGKSYKDAAYAMGVTHGTFRSFIERAYRKVGVRSRWELIALPRVR